MLNRHWNSVYLYPNLPPVVNWVSTHLLFHMPKHYGAFESPNKLVVRQMAEHRANGPKEVPILPGSAEEQVLINSTPSSSAAPLKPCTIYASNLLTYRPLLSEHQHRLL